MSAEPADVIFPKRFRPLPPGYRIVRSDSGYYLWTWGPPDVVAQGDYEQEGLISSDRFWVRRCAFANHELRTWTNAHPELARAWDEAVREDRARMTKSGLEGSK